MARMMEKAEVASEQREQLKKSGKAGGTGTQPRSGSGKNPGSSGKKPGGSGSPGRKPSGNPKPPPKKKPGETGGT
jgi:hypothetical protein